MAHFTLLRFIIFLILGLTVSCFSETTATTTAAPTTTKAATTTAAPTTIKAATTTAAPTTTKTATTTAAPTTKAQTTAATTASNMTTINMTTSSSNMTTFNMTTSSSNMTTSSMTTTPSNMTTSNMTTTPSNMTTINMTTTASTTKQPLTTKTPEARWKVTDKSGKLCMLMDFDGMITYENNRNYAIPSSASIAKSSCVSPNFSLFAVEFSVDDTFFWQLFLNFTTAKNSYKLDKMIVNLYVASTLVAYGSSKDAFLTGDLPFGDFYKCKSLNSSFYPFAVNLTNPTLQPFVQKVKTGDSLGKEYLCKNSSTGVRASVIIGIIIAIIVLAAAVGVTYYVVKRRGKPSDPPYNRVQ